ncbi:hypothetical protein BDZ91DRAFT_421306 [Kalaharituber pfeilii]|nr:hypothetical protein BDZ91DRAFT_421306 [Kalaharituber pfeilii]
MSFIVFSCLFFVFSRRCLLLLCVKELPLIPDTNNTSSACLYCQCINFLFLFLFLFLFIFIFFYFFFSSSSSFGYAGARGGFLLVSSHCNLYCTFVRPWYWEIKVIQSSISNGLISVRLSCIVPRIYFYCTYIRAHKFQKFTLNL